MLYTTGFELEKLRWMSSLKKDMLKSSDIFKTRRLCINCGGVRYQYFRILEFDKPYCFAYISAP